MRRIAFKIAGGFDVGMGHVFRCLALADMFERRGWEVGTFFCSNDPVSLRQLEGAGRVAYPYDHGRPDVTEELVRAILDHRHDAIILDQPESDPLLLEGLRRTDPNVKILALDYSDMEEDNLDVVVNLYNHNRQHARPISPKVRYAEGPSYAIMRDSFLPYIARDKETPSVAKSVLVSFGGSDIAGNTAKALHALERVSEAGMEIHLVIGPNFREADHTIAHARAMQKRVKVYQPPFDMAALMYRCELGIHGAGTMMLEMAAIGTPLVVVPQNDRERAFGQEFERRGIVIMGNTSSACTQSLPSQLTAIIHDVHRRKEMSLLGKHAVDGCGRARIVELLNWCAR